jgi:protoporphyrin/coproporphyrin ferrochelatase
MIRPRALLLLAFGGPRSLDDVEFLLTRLFQGRPPSAGQLERIKERYRLIGGSSPLPEITRKQAEGLQTILGERGFPFKAYVGMRYSHPLIEEALEEIREGGIEEVIALPMSPFQSRMSTGGYIEEVARANHLLGDELKVSFVTGWHCHPLFLEAVREKMAEGLMGFSPEERERVHVVFTAHSLPKAALADDPYIQEIEETVRGVSDSLKCDSWHIAFQSKGAGHQEWIGPDVEYLLERLAEEEVREILIVPIGFVADHIEILYDIDIAFQKKAQSLGLVLKRSPSLNVSPSFLKALASMVEDRIGTA